MLDIGVLVPDASDSPNKAGSSFSFMTIALGRNQRRQMEDDGEDRAEGRGSLKVTRREKWSSTSISCWSGVDEKSCRLLGNAGHSCWLGHSKRRTAT